MGHNKRVPVTVPLRFQVIRGYENGAEVIVAAFEEELEAERYAVEREPHWFSLEVRRDPLIEAADEHFRELVRHARVTAVES